VGDARGCSAVLNPIGQAELTGGLAREALGRRQTVYAPDSLN